jgi:hypothetical protein
MKQEKAMGKENAKRPPQIKPVKTMLPAAKPTPTKIVAKEKIPTKRPDRNENKQPPINPDNKADREIQRQILKKYILIQTLKEIAQAELKRTEEDNKDLTSQNNIPLAGYLGALRSILPTNFNLNPTPSGWHMIEEALLDSCGLPGGINIAIDLIQQFSEKLASVIIKASNDDRQDRVFISPFSIPEPRPDQ